MHEERTLCHVSCRVFVIDSRLLLLAIPMMALPTYVMTCHRVEDLSTFVECNDHCHRKSAQASATDDALVR